MGSDDLGQNWTGGGKCGLVALAGGGECRIKLAAQLTHEKIAERSTTPKTKNESMRGGMRGTDEKKTPGSRPDLRLLRAGGLSTYKDEVDHNRINTQRGPAHLRYQQLVASNPVSCSGVGRAASHERAVQSSTSTRRSYSSTRDDQKERGAMQGHSMWGLSSTRRTVQVFVR